MSYTLDGKEKVDKLAIGYPWVSQFMWTAFTENALNLQRPQNSRFFRGMGWCPARRHIHICEQAIHGLDTMNWVMGDKPPLRCWGTGGRQVRTDPKYGNIYDHFAIVYEYPENVRRYHMCRHWPKTDTRVNDHVLGSKGSCDVFRHRITGENTWRYTSKTRGNMYQVEHDALFKAIRANKPINNGAYMCISTMLAIMGRMTAYTGKTITWDMAMNSKESLAPKAYEWGDAPNRPVARPGITKFS